MLHGLTRCGRDIYGPIVLDIDLGAALLLNLANHLATWPNDGANLFWIDLDRLDARGIFRQSLARSVYRIEHLFHNVHTAFAGLLQRPGHDFVRDAFDFDVHLEGGNAVGGSRDLEVHVTQCIFDALDVTQYRPLTAALTFSSDQSHSHASDRCMNGYAGIHQSEGCTTHGAH